MKYDMVFDFAPIISLSSLPLFLSLLSPFPLSLPFLLLSHTFSHPPSLSPIISLSPSSLPSLSLFLSSYFLTLSPTLYPSLPIIIISFSPSVSLKIF